MLAHPLLSNYIEKQYCGNLFLIPDVGKQVHANRPAILIFM
jgi:hypothetical protein